MGGVNAVEVEEKEEVEVEDGQNVGRGTAKGIKLEDDRIMESLLRQEGVAVSTTGPAKGACLPPNRPQVSDLS